MASIEAFLMVRRLDRRPARQDALTRDPSALQEVWLRIGFGCSPKALMCDIDFEKTHRSPIRSECHRSDEVISVAEAGFGVLWG